MQTQPTPTPFVSPVGQPQVINGQCKAGLDAHTPAEGPHRRASPAHRPHVATTTTTTTQWGGRRQCRPLLLPMAAVVPVVVRLLLLLLGPKQAQHVTTLCCCCGAIRACCTCCCCSCVVLLGFVVLLGPVEPALCPLASMLALRGTAASLQG